MRHKQAEANAYKQRNNTVKHVIATGQSTAGGEEFIQLAQLKPTLSICREPHAAHNNDKACQGADNDGIKEYA